ncbi:BCCT family transporter [Paraurantiacibacter namhicola]|uniref:Glycine betaine transporter OpuD n=1 Tax=Paraurantiacibacter namhicola TaxID=645517 RepID=A0A1C7D4R0_9SPHN|nr:BCCT family transporter [Paraurantiacibacter namhicola]ANU06444.1 Glycine betaine transporter OpuD [Paraurantiacibacter namhicola]
MTVRISRDGPLKGYNPAVVIASASIAVLLIGWAVIYSASAGAALASLNQFVVDRFGAWYLYAMFAFVVFCVAIAAWPATGRLRLGKPGERPEFSNFSWIAMMFGAGIGMGVLTYSTAEPIFHFSTNPDVINGVVETNSADNVRSAMKWSVLHWGFSAWGCYALVGLSLAYCSFNKGLPLSLRSALYPLFGKSLSGPLGHAVDVVAVLATIVGVTITIGYGVAQFSSGLFYITGWDWVMTEAGKPALAAMLALLIVVMAISTASAFSGVEKGIKWLADVNLVLSILLLAFFLIAGPTLFELKTLGVAIWDYVTGFASMATQHFAADGSSQGDALAEWQGAWTIFYWAWWIAFAPFVGMFLARVSRGRTIREYVLGAMLVPTLVCFCWFAFIGGTALELELSGRAGGVILEADLSARLFATLDVMLGNWGLVAMSGLVVVLLITFLVTSAQSGILVIHTISSAGEIGRRKGSHIAGWGLLITAVIGVLLSVGGLDAINAVMTVGALPFSGVMVLMMFALAKTLLRDRTASSP